VKLSNAMESFYALARTCSDASH